MFGEELWRDIINFEGMAKAGSILEQDFDLVIYVETAEATWNAIRNHYGWPDVYCPTILSRRVRPISTSGRPNCQKDIDMNPPDRLRALLAEPGFLVMPAVWDGLSAKLTWQAGYKTAFLSGSCVYGEPAWRTRPRRLRRLKCRDLLNMTSRSTGSISFGRRRPRLWECDEYPSVLFGPTADWVPPPCSSRIRLRPAR